MFTTLTAGFIKMDFNILIYSTIAHKVNNTLLNIIQIIEKLNKCYFGKYVVSENKIKHPVL